MTDHKRAADKPQLFRKGNRWEVAVPPSDATARATIGACTNLDCLCRTVTLDWETTTGKAPRTTYLDFESGELFYTKDRQPVTGNDDSLPGLLGDLARSLDGRLLDEIAMTFWKVRRVRLSPGEPVPTPELGDWSPGECLYFGELIQTPRFDLFPVDGERWVLLDMYCTDPSCRCNKAILDVQHAETQEHCGYIEVPFRSRPTLHAKPGKSDVLRQVWTDYRHRYRAERGRLRQRYRALRKAALPWMDHPG